MWQIYFFPSGQNYINFNSLVLRKLDVDLTDKYNLLYCIICFVVLVLILSGRSAAAVVVQLFLM